MISKEEIKKLRELERRAKRTPWEVSCADILAPDPNRDNRLQALVCGCEQGTASVVDDFEFIAALRNAAKELLDAAEENARLRSFMRAKKTKSRLCAMLAQKAISGFA